MWFDSHCHLDFPDFDEEPAQLWKHAQHAGIRQMFVPGVAPKQWARLGAVRALPGVVTGVGLHPFALQPAGSSTVAESVDGEGARQAALGLLEKEVAGGLNVAIGECGWDRGVARRHPALPLSVQTQVVQHHLRLAQKYRLPVVLHVVHAHGLALETLRQTPPPLGGVVHAYSGPAELVAQYEALGFCLGYGVALLRDESKRVRAALIATRPDRVLLETDAPYRPSAARPWPNSPLLLLQIAQVAAQVRNTSLGDLAHQTSANARRLFGQCERSALAPQ